MMMRRKLNMPKLEVKENKKLVLKNVLKKEFRGAPLDSIDQEVVKFIQKVDLLKVQIFGPFIIHNIGTNIHDDGTMTMDFDLMIQANDYKQYKHEFMTEERHVCEHCIYVHYEGSPENVSYAHAKLDLHIYENDLLSNGEMYTVCIRDQEDYTVMDFFRPVMLV